MKKELKDSLKKYSALAGATALVTGASAQIEYTDVNLNADSIFDGNHQFDFDLNNDLIMDFRIQASTSYTSTSSTSSSTSASSFNLRAGALNSNSVLLDSSSYVRALSNGSIVSSSASSWGNTSSALMARVSYYYSRYYSTSSTTYLTYSSTTSTGPWLGTQQNKFIGLKLNVGSDTYYGWVRLDVNISLGTNQARVKDYAFQTCPNIPIHAGDASTIFAPVAGVPAGTDIANNGNGLDLQVAFKVPSSEVGISQYRIFVVDSADAATFNVDSAKAVPVGNYTTHTPNGANYTSALQATSTDVKGTLITNNKPYAIFVMSLHDGVNTNDPILTAASPIVTLRTAVGVEEVSNQEWNAYVSDNRLMIKATSDMIGSDFKLIDQSGRTVSTGRINQASESFEINDVATGVYVLAIDGEQGALSQKLYIR